MAGEVTLLEQARTIENPQAQKIVNVFALEYAINTLMPYTGGVSGFFYPWTVADTLPTVAPRDFNAEFTADHGKSSNYQVPWKNYGGVLKVDKALKKGNPTGAVRQEIMQLQAIAKKWAQDCIAGTGGVSMTGIHGFISSFFPGQVVNAGTTASGDLLTLAMMDSALDLISDPSAIFCTKKVRNRLTALARTATTHNINFEIDQFGMKVMHFNKIPVYVMQDEMTSADILSTTEIDGAGTNSDTSSLTIVRFGEDGVHGFTPDPSAVISVTEESRDNFDQKRLEKNAAIVVEVPRAAVRVRYIKEAVS
jgi:hypothetical protein